MGLFRNDPAEKKLKEITGGFTLKSEFIRHLESLGLEIHDGNVIKWQIKEEIKQGKVTADNVEERLETLLMQCVEDKKNNSSNDDKISCPQCGFIQSSNNSFCINCGQSLIQNKTCPVCNQIQEANNKFCINCGQSLIQNKTCPVCNQIQEANNKFCISCGYDFENDVKQPSIEIRRFKFLANQEHNLKECPNCSENILKDAKFCHSCGSEIKDETTSSTETFKDDISELEALYNKSVSEKYSPNFKFAYVIFLNSYGKRFLKSTEREYKITENDLNTQAIKDEFVMQASPLVAAQKSTVSDLKEILKAHNLKVSGKKDELIERLGDNLSAEELEEIFPEKSYELSAEGQKFIDENDYVLFYEDNYNLKRAFTPSEFERIFRDGEYSSKEEMCSLIIKKIESKQNMDIYDVESLIILYKEVNDQLKLLDNYFRLFIYSINSNMYYSSEDEMNSLYSLLHSLSLDIDDLKSRFHDVYSNFNIIELKINEKDSFTFLLKLFSGASIYEIEEEVNQKFFAFD